MSVYVCDSPWSVYRQLGGSDMKNRRKLKFDILIMYHYQIHSSFWVKSANHKGHLLNRFFHF